jgi:dTDP-4-amino-4,6-dideoxygalactose transaminase
MIPFNDLRAQYHSIKEEIDIAVHRVLESAQFVSGEEVHAFEQRFAAYCRARYAVGVNSGTSALHLALLASGIGPGDEVITTPMTFVATVAAIIYVGARAVFVDVDPHTWNIDPALIPAVLTRRTKAIIPVHLHGRPAEMDPILEIARARRLVVIEDAAHAHGADYHGRRIGSIANITCFSFYPGKNLGAYGEGGAITTDNPEYDRKARLLRDWGQHRKYEHVVNGYNYRMDGLQSAILRVKLNYLERWIDARRAHAARYDALLREYVFGLPLAASTNANIRHVYHVYAIRVPKRDCVRQALGAAGIETGIHYCIPIHMQPGYAGCGYKAGDFPVAEQLAQEFLSLPMFPELTSEQLETIGAAVVELAKSEWQVERWSKHT